MQLLDLPLELFLEVWDILEDKESLEAYEAMNALVRTCHYFYDNFNSRLYHAVAQSGTHSLGAMEWAIRRGPTITTDRLLDAGIDMTNKRYRSIFTMAAGHNCVDSIKLLLRRGIDPNTGNHMEQTALHWAAICDHVEIAQLLLDAGADINSQDSDSYTALSYAVAKGRARMLKLLLERGALTDVTMEYPGASLALAAKKGHADVVNLLLERGASVDYGGTESDDTPLTWAARFGHHKILTRLLDAGANINAITDRDKSCLHLAAAGGHPEVVRILLERGMDPDTRDGRGNSPLSWACYARSPNEEVVAVLLEHDVDLETKSDGGITPLAIAARLGFAGVIRPLLAKGANSTSTDDLGCTPLILATRYGHADVVFALLDDGTPPDTWSPREYTTEEKGRHDYRRSIDIPDSRGRTALFLATMYGFKEIVQLLLCRGSTAMHTPSCAGRTPATVVDEQKQTEYTAGNEHLQPMWQVFDKPLDATVDVAQVQAFSEEAQNDSVVEAWCDRCDTPLSVWDSHFHCDECHDGDYDMCAECVARGETFHAAIHPLYKTRRVNDSWYYNHHDPVQQLNDAVVTRELSDLAITA